MLSREDHHMIKQLRRQGCHIVDIAHQIGCSERTVRRQLALPAPCSGKRKVTRPGKLDPFKAIIDQQLEQNVWNAEVIYQMLREQGYSGGRTLVRTYIQPKRVLRPARQTVRFETPPAQQLQHDWGILETEIAGQRCKVSIAVNSLGYSRRFHVWATLSQDAEHTYQSLIESFHYFDGVPKTVLVDNQKAAVLSHQARSKAVFNEGFLQLAAHYGFTPHACRPQRPRTKGKVERMVGYVKQHFFQRYRQFDSLAHLNQQLTQWLADTADQRPLRQFQQTPADRFRDEQPKLSPLPVQDFDTRYYDIRQVSWDSYIEVRGNRYSVPSEYCGQPVTIRISLTGELSVYDISDTLLARHILYAATEGWQRDRCHHQALWEQTLSVEKRDLNAYEEVLR